MKDGPCGQNEQQLQSKPKKEKKNTELCFLQYDRQKVDERLSCTYACMTTREQSLENVPS